MSLKWWKIQLKDHVTGNLITTAGGNVQVVSQGTFDKVALKDSAGASASNPASITNGLIEFYTATTILAVDLYIRCPGGEFVVAKNIKPSGPNEISVDTNQQHQVMRIPFSHADITANTETDTGFDIPENAQVLPLGMGVFVNNVETGLAATMDVGILSTEAGGDADGFMDGILIGSVTTTDFKKATAGFTIGSVAVHVDLTGGTQEFTLGALLVGSGTKVASLVEGNNTGGDAGFYLLEPYKSDGTAVSVSVTIGTALTTADGLIVLPYIKAPNS